jgi:hypothetical protein
MEWRARIRVPGVDVEGGAAGDLLTVLERDVGHFGPVLSGEPGGVDVILATDAPDEAAAACELYSAVGRALAAAELGNAYPVAIELEPGDE